MSAQFSPYKILCVDDERLALKLFERVFEDDPRFRLFTATSPKQALELLRTEDVDLVISDERMAEMAGMELLARVRELQPRAIRILLTAYPELESSLQAINQGLLYRFVLKPWDADDMRVTVQRAVESKRVAEENERLSTALRQHFDELVEAERMAVLGRLSAGIGNEIGNTLNAMLANVGFLEDELPACLKVVEAASVAVAGHFREGTREPLVEAIGKVRPGPMRSRLLVSLQAINAAGKQLDSIGAGLKRYGRPSPTAESFDANQGVLLAVQLLRHRFKGALRLEHQLGPIPVVAARGQEIVQVVMSLLSNAADAVDEVGGGKVSVRTWGDTTAVQIEVSDTGKGVAPEVREKLFTPFFTTKKAGHGGLGLSIARSIVEGHGGRIELEPNNPNGTRVTVTLPVQSRPPPPPPAES